MIQKMKKIYKTRSQKVVPRSRCLKTQKKIQMMKSTQMKKTQMARIAMMKPQ